MAWVKLDDEFASNPKLMEAGPLGMAMQVAALCYCNRLLTDGRLSRPAAATLLSFEGLAMRMWSGEVAGGGEDAEWQFVADDLVAAGVWHEPGHDCPDCPPITSGYYLHDYLHFQPSRAQVEAERVTKQEAGRKGGRAAAQARAQATATAPTTAGAPANGVAESKPDPVPDPVPLEEPPPTPPSLAIVPVEPLPPVAAGDRHRAESVVNRYWTATNPKPVVKWIALVKLVEQFLIAGHDEAEMDWALRATRCFTKDALTYVIRQHRPEERKRPKGMAAAERLHAKGVS